MQARRPNIIWVIADQMRAQAMSHRGDPNARTPHLDQLAAEGVSFVHAVAGTPLCSPFRGSLVTGRYPHRSTVPGHDVSLAAGARTIAHVFRANGYRTCWIGKWHLDGRRERELDLTREENQSWLRIIPPARRGGFEDWWAYENNNDPFKCWVNRDREDGTTESFRLPRYETDSLTDILIAWMTERVSRHRDQPFFGSLSVQPPHDPYVAPAECMEHYEPSTLALRPNVPPVKRITDTVRADLPGYYAAIERLDWNLGRIRDALVGLGIADDTYLIFFSDHGDLHGSHGQFRKTAPWEEAIRVPFIVGAAGAKRRVATSIPYPINHVDIAPTTLGLCGIEKPDFMDGFDCSAVLANDVASQDLPKDAYLSLPVAPGDPDTVDRPFRGVVTSDGWKYVVLEGQPWLMFDLNEDPYELVNLAHNTRFGQQRTRLHGRLARWVSETQDRFTLPALV